MVGTGSPRELPPRGVPRGLKFKCDADAWNGRERVATPHKGQRVALPPRQTRLLQQALHGVVRPIGGEPDALAAGARPQAHGTLPKLGRA